MCAVTWKRLTTEQAMAMECDATESGEIVDLTGRSTVQSIRELTFFLASWI